MPSRLLAVLLLFAVIPTVELAEQLEHAVAHAFEGDAPDHSAHHEEQHSDEHGCTGLIHLCSCHHAQVTIGCVPAAATTVLAFRSPPAELPHDLADLNSLEPPNRPPIS